MMRILLIEDEEPARIGLRRRLGKLGHTVDEAETAGQAVERMRQEAYDLLLLDIMLPEEGDMLGERPVRDSGKRFLERLRDGECGEVKTPTDVPVVAITAVSDLDVIGGLRDGSVALILQKPIDPDDAIREMREKGLLREESHD